MVGGTMTTITANVSRMFGSLTPWDVSNSLANLGLAAARLTWHNALLVAEQHEDWLGTPLEEACQGMREWMRESGGWDAEEIGAKTYLELLGVFVQLIAGELQARRLDLHVGSWTGEKCLMMEYRLSM